MPSKRQAWAEAMRTEFNAVATADRLSFAAGCLWVAVRERVHTVQMLVTIGRWGVGLVTAAYAGFHLFGGLWVLSILFGGRDGYHDLLVAHGHLQAAANLHASRPGLAMYLLCMAAGNLLAAVYLVRWRPRLFMLGCALVAAVIVVSLTGPFLSGHLNNRTIYGWQFVPLAMLAGAAALLAWIANRKSRRLAA